MPNIINTYKKKGKGKGKGKSKVKKNIKKGKRTMTTGVRG